VDRPFEQFTAHKFHTDFRLSEVTFQLGDGGQDCHVAAAADEISSDHYLLQMHAQGRGWGKKKTRRITSFLISTLAWEKIRIFLHKQAN
jgi:hypothetical protein